jgi:hypothetical protein
MKAMKAGSHRTAADIRCRCAAVAAGSAADAVGVLVMRRSWVLMLALVWSPTVMAVELVVNGGFENDLPPAWEEEATGSSTFVGRSTSYHGDPDFEVLVQKGTGNGFTALDQTVIIPSVDVDFSVSAMLLASATSGGPWAASGVALHYETQFGDVLGTTAIVGTTIACPWIDTDILHLIPAPDTAWNDYVFNVEDELANLPGVDMMAVHQIRISLFGQVGGDC